jgi:peptidyl-prolyl cis-trans isomerase C
MSKLSIITVCVALVVAAGCSRKSDATVAEVNGKAVTRAEWDAYVKFKRLSASEAAKASAMDGYLTRAGLADVIQQEKGLDSQLVQAELEEFRKELLISRYFEKYLADKVTDAAIQSYYDAHAQDYEDHKVHVAHILVRLNPKLSEEERKARLTTAHAAYSQIKAGKDFGAVAAEVSEDNVTAKNAGDLGWLREGSVDPAFSKRAFATAAGEVTEPFETPFGFHILKVLEAPQTIRKPLQAVRGDIRYQLRAQAKQAEMDRLLAKTEIEVGGKPRKAPKDERTARK